MSNAPSGCVHALRYAGLVQVGADVERAGAHALQHVPFGRKVQHPLAIELPPSAIGEEQMQQSMALAAAAAWAPAIQPQAMLEAEEPAAITADRAFADQFPASTGRQELAAILQEAFDAPAGDAETLHVTASHGRHRVYRPKLAAGGWLEWMRERACWAR